MSQVSSRTTKPTMQIKKIKELCKGGGIIARQATVIRKADGSEAVVDDFGRVDWITKPYYPPKKELWSYSSDGPWYEGLDEIPVDSVVIEFDGAGTVYRGIGILANPENIVPERAIDLIIEALQSEAMEQDHYLPDDWLEGPARCKTFRHELQRAIVNCLAEQGQTGYYTVDHYEEVSVIESYGSLSEFPEPEKLEHDAD